MVGARNVGLGWLERSLSEIAQQVSACDCEGCACKPVRCESPACMGQLLLFEQQAIRDSGVVDSAHTAAFPPIRSRPSVIADTR